MLEYSFATAPSFYLTKVSRVNLNLIRQIALDLSLYANTLKRNHFCLLILPTLPIAPNTATIALDPFSEKAIVETITHLRDTEGLTIISVLPNVGHKHLAVPLKVII